MPLVVEQVVQLDKYTKGDLSLYEASTETYLIPCISSMAAAIANDLLWKPMNHRVLLHTRDPRAHVRYAALRTVQECFVVVGEEFLALLPECLAFLSELMEDDDPRIERLCKDLIKYLEELSGESMEEYFQ